MHRARPYRAGPPVGLLALLAFLLAFPLAPAAADEAAAPTVRQPAGAIIVPDTFLRRWDPVTVFFDRDTGPAADGAEDAPERFVTVSPAHPGAWTWLNPRTLQFRPAEPWPALSRFTWHIGAREVVLSRLLDPPVKTLPANGAANLDRVESLTLEFAEPLDIAALAQILEISLAPLPGLDATRTRRLQPRDFDIKPLERKTRADHASYVVALHQPVPSGTRITLRLNLSPDPGLTGTVERIEFSTATSFRPILLGCANQRVPLSAEGTVYDRGAALACKTETVAATTPAQPTAPPEQSADETSAQPSSSDATPAPEGDAGSDNAASGDMASGSDQGEEESSDQEADQGTDQGGTTTIVDARRPGPLATASAASPAQGSFGKGAAPQPLPSGKREVVVQFSAVLGALDPLAVRNLVRISPAVDGVKIAAVGDQLRLAARFKTDTLYEVALEPAALKDRLGRDLVMPGRSAAWLYWPAEPDFLELGYGQGIVERYGPQMLPLRGRGYASADLRIHAIDPLDRSFWPFPTQPVTTSDDARPPSPGEAAEPWTKPAPIASADELKAQLARLGSPSVSSLVRLPLTPLGASARFGLDLAPPLAGIAGKDQPGTYLVGVRALDSAGQRAWMRLQVTDLSLTAVEEERSVRFYVTSLSDGRPVESAHVEIDGQAQDGWRSLAEGETESDGHFTWQGGAETRRTVLGRIVVSKGTDVLVVDPGQPLDRYTAAGWFPQPQGWLGWMAGDLSRRHPLPHTLCHLFTERPIYRPEDPVHIKAYIRSLADGLISPPVKGLKTELVVTGPEDGEWRYPVTPSETGSLHYLFAEKTTATGLYQARLEVNGTRCASAEFKKDAYRLPRFQVRLDVPRSIALDKPATVGMTATYYAGGPAGDRPVRWRITQFPYAFAPQPREGFVYATDARFAEAAPIDSTAMVERPDKTDGEGRASLALDPTRERTSQPRRYVVEATVTGDDDKTVTNSAEVLALPAFVLALKVPRYLEEARSIPVAALMVDGEGKPIGGREVTLRLKQRQWSSILQASDFTDGKPKYRTEVIEEPILERSITTGADAVALDLPIPGSGVYVVELDAADALGRHQVVSVDLFAGGGRPVTWSRPPAQVFKVTPDKPAYVPGETANLVLESPFQSARALAIVEAPDGRNRYQWLDIANGYGTLALPIDKSFMPRVPVHFALMRGRLAGDAKSGDAAPGALDLRRPETIAATAWIGVKPVKNQVTVGLELPPQAQPGDTVELTVKLSDDTGSPVPGEVTLWLIDQAVLALAKEAPLDPLPAFIRDHGTRLALVDTRNLPFGLLPLDEDPGGDVGEGDQQLLNRVTIRKNFQPMPYYEPALMVDRSGIARVRIKLPDDLTVFRVRAKAVSGADRFGFATGQIAVRLPVIVEPNLPRFLRPGDRFALAGIGRIVEGGGGAGRVELKVDGLALAGPASQSFDWQPGKPQRFAFPATVPSPRYGADGALQGDHVRVTLGVERSADGAHDAFQVDLPIRPDRAPLHRRQLVDLTAGTPLALPAIEGAARPGTVRRTLTLAADPTVVRLAAALDYLRAYPFGCTEQRVSLARAELGTRQLAAALGNGGDQRAERSVAATLAWLATVTQDSGLVAYWPGDTGSVALTAWSVEFMVEARKAGFAVDPSLLAPLLRALRQSLRSDYPNLVSGADFIERAWALAALATAGELDRGYAAELARKADQLSLEGVAQVRLALQAGQAVDAPVQKSLEDALWRGLVVKQRDGKPIYGGLQDGIDTGRFPQILPSETRSLAAILRATADSADPRRRLVADALIALGQGNGWGTTNADAEALLALARYTNGNRSLTAQNVTLALPGGTQQAALSADRPVRRIVSRDGGPVTVTAAGATADRPVSVQSDLTWLPVEDGSQVAPEAAGFVVTRESAIIDAAGAPPRRTKLDRPAIALKLRVGEVVEDSLEVVNPVERHHVAITLPLAAGMEPLNPTLATAPPEARPSAEPSLKPSYVAFLDDGVSYFYDTLPKGSFAFHLRSKAAVPGRFIQPAAEARMMYDEGVTGRGAGAAVEIDPAAAPN